METEEKNAVNVGSFEFAPDWARKDAGVVVGKVRREQEFDDNRARGDRPPKRGMGDKPNGFKKPFVKSSDRKPRFEDRPKPLDAEVKLLPDTKALGTIIRKLQQDSHAYKLKDLAFFFLNNPSSVLLKIVMRDGTRFHQCKACGFAAQSEADVIDHILSAHLENYYTAKEVECEPPKGNFTCVAKCGLSGVLLGPPNAHDFNTVVKEMIRTRYPGMSEADYRSRIEMVRDADTIEEWRKSATKKIVFLPKAEANNEGVATLSREQAESAFRRTILANLLDSPKNLMITADVAMKSPLRPLQWAAKDALNSEHAIRDIAFALRGAFHNRKLKFFRANDARGPEFVTNIEYKEFDAAHAIPELAKVASFIAEHPCSMRAEIVTDPEIEKHLVWLVSTGHVVAFTNGAYSAVEKFPKYGPQWRKKKSSKAPADKAPVEKAVENAPVEEASSAAPVEETASSAPIEGGENVAPVGVTANTAPVEVTAEQAATETENVPS